MAGNLVCARYINRIHGARASSREDAREDAFEDAFERQLRRHARTTPGYTAAVIEREPRRLTDAQLTLTVGFVLFALAAWPLLLVDLPPFQDLPNHVASVHILLHPELYPEYVSNGFFKSNSLLTLWLSVVGRHGLYGAARLFTALVLAVNALALPTFVFRFAGRRALLVATLFGWPLVHGFFVSMGMLNFAFAFGLSLLLLTVIDQQREHPTPLRGVAIAVTACMLWYAHPFPLAVVGGLVVLHAASRSTWRTRLSSGLALLSPIVPAMLLSAVSALHHLVKAERAPITTAAAGFAYLNPLEIAYHLWTDVSGALTWWGSATLVPALLLPLFAWKQRREARPFLSLRALGLLAAAYVALPVMMSNWWYLHCRLVPFLWAGLAIRLPSRLPRPLTIALVACALLFSATLGIDYVRLDGDRAAFTAGMSAVPERATLLPLLFSKSKTSDFIASLTHAWGYYTVARNTSAPLVFAIERSYPIRYREFPPAALIPPVLDRLAEGYGTPTKVCASLGHFPVQSACTAAWRDLWDAFWRQAEPRFSHVLTWAIPAEARPMIPASYRRTFVAGALEIYAKATTGSVGFSP
jgi:hypothetical protein